MGPARLERATSCSGGKRSIQLSYGPDIGRGKVAGRKGFRNACINIGGPGAGYPRPSPSERPNRARNEPYGLKKTRHWWGSTLRLRPTARSDSHFTMAITSRYSDTTRVVPSVARL